MKIILPSLAWFTLSAGWVFAQAPPQQAVSPSLSISPSAAGASGLNPNLSGLPADSPPRSAEAAVLQPRASIDPVTPAQDRTNVPSPLSGVDVFMQRVTTAVGQLPSVQARIRYHTNLFGQQTVGAGLYLQQGLGEQRQFRLELKTALGQQLLTFQQVCDGKFLWQYQDPFEKPKAGAAERTPITRIDLRKVRQLLEDGNPEIHGEPSMMTLSSQFALGGLPKLLGNLQDSFRFTRVEPGQLDALPVWIAVGSWRPEAIAGVSKDLATAASREQPLNLKLLPPQLPEQVWLYVGQDDLFPYRIEYRRRAQGRGGDAARAEMLPMVTVEFYEVQLNAQINPREFVYEPGSTDVVDATDAYVKKLKGNDKK